MKQLFNSIKIIAIALIIGLGVSYVSAAPWAAPGAAPTGGNTVASVNVSDYAQTKIGSFITENFLKAGGAISPTGAPWNKAGYAVAEKAFISPWSFFTSAFLPGNTSQVKIGGGDDATTDIFNAAVTPFTIDLAGRGTGNNSVSGRQVIDIRTDVSECYPNATIRTNTPAVRLLNSKTGDDADAIVRGVQLSGGNPAPGKILVSTDKYGNAIWGTPTLSGGQIVFTYGTSPAATGQALCSNTPPPVDVCPNIAGNQNSIPNGMIVDGSGNCVTPAAVDLCTNIAGDQLTVPPGMVKDTPGNTPGNCTTPPVDVCPNIAGVQESTPAGYELNAGQCGRWLSYGKPASTTNGQTCRSWIQNKTPGWPYTPIESGKFRTVSRENLGNGLTGGIVNIYPDQCVYGRYSNITLTALNGALLSNFDTIPTQPGNYFGPRSSINGGTPWVIYEFQYFYPQ